MPKPPRAACALLASGLLAACSPGPASAPAAAVTPETATPPAAEQPLAQATPQPGALAAPPPGAPAPSGTPSGTPEAAPPETAPPRPEPPPPPPPSPVTAVLRQVAAVEPGGAATALARTGETVVDPSVSFRVELAVPTTDARLVLLDGADALVSASGSQEVGATTRLTLSPAAPLTPGARYTLRVDGAVTRELHDSSGKAYAPAALALRAAGQPPPPEPKQKPKKRR
ncbi:hypothetical protein [Anaeromyxobacter oryzae]|uniref:SbsA Ig-like domain-containing protein n=1 Tax=Anaeromyxobacter oryzae TaxID=2918170 RepID=A0ABN6MZW9_9BACT|nr:hypothetical protein [Anaeromyxobacter oryzae]BDG06519.1 hypothetical protein AMOR_55150 [Anaeromyxobacter oryzae]